MRRLSVLILVLVGLWGSLPAVAVDTSDERFSNEEDAADHGVEMFNPDAAYGLQAYRLPGSSSGKPRIAMTIDDGTSARTNDILDGLERLERQGVNLDNLVLTWFINAREPVPGTIQRILDAGHALASHGYYHLNLTTLSCGEIRKMVVGVEEFVNARIREPIQIRAYRPPWGATNSRVQECTDSIGYQWWNWTIDTADYKYPGRAVIVSRMEKAKDGDIILMHDSSDKYDSVAALLDFIAEHHDDYEFVPIPGAAMLEPCETGSFEDLCKDHWGSAAAEWALANGITVGCKTDDDRLYLCPERVTSRGEDAAFVARQEKPAATNEDFFVDDNGHLFEGSINRLTNTGTYKGCNPPENTRVCIDDPITRGAKIVTIVRRLAGLQPASKDYFLDDDGTWYESSANIAAENGLVAGCNPPANDRVCGTRPLTRIEDIVLEKRVADWKGRRS